MRGIVNGRMWLSDRRAFLLAELSKDPSEEQRAAIEAELAALAPELASSRRRWSRWWLFGTRPPG